MFCFLCLYSVICFFFTLCAVSCILNSVLCTLYPEFRILLYFVYFLFFILYYVFMFCILYYVFMFCILYYVFMFCILYYVFILQNYLSFSPKHFSFIFICIFRTGQINSLFQRIQGPTYTLEGIQGPPNTLQGVHDPLYIRLRATAT